MPEDVLQAESTACEPVGGAPSLPAGTVTELAARVYERALDRSSMTVDEVALELGVTSGRAERAVADLHALRLIRPVSGVAFAAVSPDAARLELTVPLERTIHDARSELAGIQDRLQSFTHLFNDRQSSRLSRQLLISLDASDDIRARLAHLAGGCRSELLIMQAAHAGAVAELALGGPFVLELLQRGVRTRLICPHTLRADTTSRSWLDQLAAAGAEVRTCNESFDPLLICDGEVAFLCAGADGEDAGPGVLAYEPTLVGFLRKTFERRWETAARIDAAEPGYGETLGHLKATILELLASGLKDDVIARRVGMSSRTFRRHIAAIMQELQAESRFQAGARAALSGLVG